MIRYTKYNSAVNLTIGFLCTSFTPQSRRMSSQSSPCCPPLDPPPRLQQLFCTPPLQTISSIEPSKLEPDLFRLSGLKLSCLAIPPRRRGHARRGAGDRQAKYHEDRFRQTYRIGLERKLAWENGSAVEPWYTEHEVGYFG
jgi:hypothetical protein